jgi:hypothetical protein
MVINSTNIYADIILGILEFAVLVMFFMKTEKYSTFQPSYYYYLLVFPCLGLLKIFEIIVFPKANIDPTQVDFVSSNNSQLSTNRRSQILELLQLPFLSLPIILPTCIELLTGIISIVLKFILTKSVAIDDLYVIHYIPAILSLAPLYSKQVQDYLPSNMVNSIYNPYNFVGIGLNTLVLITGGLIGLNICNRYLL